jgi:rhodanese-related sulfurtransferase
MVLVDVREVAENMRERISGDVLEPLSTFDPANLPDPAGRRVVFYCRSGNRSVKSSLMAQAAGLPYDAHLAGGILGWKAAGFETESD